MDTTNKRSKKLSLRVGRKVLANVVSESASEEYNQKQLTDCEDAKSSKGPNKVLKRLGKRQTSPIQTGSEAKKIALLSVIEDEEVCKFMGKHNSSTPKTSRTRSAVAENNLDFGYEMFPASQNTNNLVHWDWTNAFSPPDDYTEDINQPQSLTKEQKDKVEQLLQLESQDIMPPPPASAATSANRAQNKFSFPFQEMEKALKQKPQELALDFLNLSNEFEEIQNNVSINEEEIIYSTTVNNESLTKIEITPNKKTGSIKSTPNESSPSMVLRSAVKSDITTPKRSEVKSVISDNTLNDTLSPLTRAFQQDDSLTDSIIAVTDQCLSQMSDKKQTNNNLGFVNSFYVQKNEISNSARVATKSPRRSEIKTSGVSPPKKAKQSDTDFNPSWVESIKNVTSPMNTSFKANGSQIVTTTTSTSRGRSAHIRALNQGTKSPKAIFSQARTTRRNSPKTLKTPPLRLIKNSPEITKVKDSPKDVDKSFDPFEDSLDVDLDEIEQIEAKALSQINQTQKSDEEVQLVAVLPPRSQALKIITNNSPVNSNTKNDLENNNNKRKCLSTRENNKIQEKYNKTEVNTPVLSSNKIETNRSSYFSKITPSQSFKVESNNNNTKQTASPFNNTPINNNSNAIQSNNITRQTTTNSITTRHQLPQVKNNAINKKQGSVEYLSNNTPPLSSSSNNKFAPTPSELMKNKLISNNTPPVSSRSNNKFTPSPSELMTNKLIIDTPTSNGYPTPPSLNITSPSAIEQLTKNQVLNKPMRSNNSIKLIPKIPYHKTLKTKSPMTRCNSLEVTKHPSQQQVQSQHPKQNKTSSPLIRHKSASDFRSKTTPPQVCSIAQIEKKRLEAKERLLQRQKQSTK